MEAGTRVWSYESNGEDPWILSEIISRSSNSITLKHINSEGSSDTTESPKPFTRQLLTSSSNAEDSASEGAKYEGVELANAQLSSADIADGMDNDMISLPHLHEPAILHAVSERYFRGEIYTWTGPVLIAVNPFQRLPLYTREILENYRQEGFIRSQNLGVDSNAKPLGPHVYSIADRSYRQMMADERKSQSILISGESGAGKTETTKIVMLYLTTLGTPEDSAGGGGGGPNVEVGVEEIHDSNEKLSIMERVLQSNPILEAFGNAKTLRNDNSSRFGKFIELGFNRAGILQGARVQTYLLEKVRIGFHASGERNYHIFYQLLRGATEEQHHKYCFHDGLTGGLELANYFHLTGQGGAPTLREFTDEEGLKYTLKSMRSMGWDEGKIDMVLSIVAGILHLGQVKFESKMSDGGQEIAQIADDKTVADAAKLLGVDVDKLTTALTVRIMVTRGDEIRIDLAPDKAQDARDALAKTVYGALFLWVVKEVNTCIMWENDKDIRSSAGVLDIFGFESFAVNSFEQLCINFTNEALQQQFNKFIFKLEQEEYERENISWAFISFPDNQDCLDTIQSRPKGILTMLDDECKLGQRGSDRNWAKRLNETYLPEKNQEVSENTRYSATKMQQAKGIFCVRHFAGNVAYTAETSFLEKNRDEIPLTAQTLFEEDSSDLIKEIYNVQVAASEDTSASAKSGAAKSKTVSQQFKAQLTSLIEMIETTDPHYIRCLKPNDAAKPKLMTRKRLTEQLRYGGVLEAVRVARMGYPVRMDHSGFFKRYRMLLPSISEDRLPWSAEDQDPQQLSEKLLDIVLEEGAKPSNYVNEDGSISRANQIRKAQRQPDAMVFPKEDVQLGKTKIFMRKGPHDKLESHRVFHQNASVTLIQSWMRMMQQNRRYLIMEDAALTIERWYRGCLGRARWWRLREAQAGQLLTNNFRMQINRRKYNKARSGTVLLQALYRGRNARKIIAATKIQSYYRMHVHSKAFRKLKSAIISLQCRVRRGIAKKVFDQVKREAKDMGKVKEHNEKLKAEMASLKAMLQAQAANDAGKEKYEKAIKEKQAEIDRLEARIAQLEAALAKEKENVLKLENDLASQKEGNRKLTSDLQYQKEKAAQTPMRRKQSSDGVKAEQLAEAMVIGATVSSEDLAQHHAEVARLEEELEEERKMSRAMRIQIKNLRSSMADKGVVDVTASTDYISDAVSEMSGSEMDTSDVPDPSDVEQVRSNLMFKTPEKDAIAKDAISTAIGQAQEDLRDLKSTVSDYFPMIKRGFLGDEPAEEEAEVVAVGWKHDVASRRDREQILRDEVRVFERKSKKFYSLLEEGIDVTLWQLNQSAEVSLDGPATEEFVVKSSSMSLKLHRRGELLVQTVLTFNSTGGYLSKALGRRRDKAAHEPLPLNDILEVKAGCEGYDHAQLPSSSSKKGKSSKMKSENMQSGLFLTIKATPTPMASSRSYFLRFKSRSARNDMLMGLRGILADLQVHEGISISLIQSPVAVQHARRMPGSTHKNAQNPFLNQRPDVRVPLADVHDLINKERESYDRLLLTMLQGNADLKEKEDELLSFRDQLHRCMLESAEKDRTQANDSKLIMQLSKKLETLLMENEDLRDNNDRLNQRLVQVECEKLEIMNGGRS